MVELIVLHCRPGFEKECAAEICQLANGAGIPGFARTEPQQGFVVFQPYEPEHARRLYEVLSLDQLVFARQWFVGLPELARLSPSDRVSPIVNPLMELGLRFHDVLIETPDTNDGKSLSKLARKLTPPLRNALSEGGLLRPADSTLPRAHLLLTSGRSVYPGYSLENRSSPWLQGIPRLRLPRGAPSRAVLKLEEALHTFLTAGQRAAWLGEGRTAVDLGAAPGGWTWLLVRQGLQVTAVDNGDLLAELAHSPQVEHLRTDGFTFRPKHPVHWLVCDIVEQPRRVAALIADWFAEGWCERALFNLKLPMKKRYDEVQQCLHLIRERIAGPYTAFQLRAKQLYHDREEVTLFLAPGAHE